MAGYQKPSSGMLEDGRDPVSSEESMAQDSGIGFDGQGMRAKICTERLDDSSKAML